MTSELLLSKLPVTRRVLFLIFLVFSLRNTLFLVNYTTYPWIGSGIFRLAAFCNLKKESVAADSHTFPLVSLQQGLLVPLFSVSWAPLLEFFCLHCQRLGGFYGMNGSLYKHQWLEFYLGRVEVLQAKLGLWFVSVVTGSGSPEVSCVLQLLQLFWFRSAENPKPCFQTPVCV